jgi:hypothetical protein
MGTVKRRWIESMEPKEEPPMERERLQSADSGYTDGISADGTSKTLAVIDSLRGDLEVRRLQLEAAAGEIERLRSQPCPYVTGTVTRYCTLTPFTLTDAEREAVDRARIAFRDMDHNDMTMQQIEDYEAICGLLERTRETSK